MLIGLLRLRVNHWLIIKIPGIFSSWLASILRTLNKQLGVTLNRRRGRKCVLISRFTKLMFSDVCTHCSQRKSFSWKFQEYWSYTMNTGSNTDWFKTWFNWIIPIPADKQIGTKYLLSLCCLFQTYLKGEVTNSFSEIIQCLIESKCREQHTYHVHIFTSSVARRPRSNNTRVSMCTLRFWFLNNTSH